MINIVTPEFIPGEGGSHYGESAVGTISNIERQPFFLCQEQVAITSGVWPVPDGTYLFRFANYPRDESLGYRIGRSYAA